MSPRLENLVEALRQLSATGPDGFEGFVRDLLAKVTGHEFRLLKSGHQGGIDVLQESLANGLVIGLEGKRYGEATTLPLDSLQYKLFDATRSHPALDLWLLAATREISATDAKALRQLGEELGVAVDILDWPSGPDSLPPLAVLCAAAPRVVRAQAYLGNAPEITDCITWVQQHERFEAERKRLIQRLRQADIGYATARACLAAWLYRSLKDRGTAKAKLPSFANLLDPTVKRIHRPIVNAALNTWWDCHRNQALVLLGDEGMGKTWAVLSWWLDRSGEDGEGLPLTLFISASDLSSHDHDPVPLIVEALATRTELRTEEFWKKRLRLWKQDRSDTPKILLVIDGLNQNWLFRGWADLLQPLFGGAWRDQAAVILTCRPDHWRNKLKELCNLEPRPYPVSVSRFDDNELAEILSLHGLHRRDFGDALLDLMRIPRLCQIAIERRDALQESGDITRERLIYEDWKHRLTVHGEHFVSDAEFSKFVGDLGRRLLDDITSARDGTITRREMIKQLGWDSGVGPENLATTISEIVDGHWLEPTDRDRPHQFRLRPDLAPYALGLALVDELRSVGDMTNLPDRLAFFLDPLQGQYFSVDILRAASTVAILEDNCPAAIRHCLVEAWISAQNFRPEDFDAYWRLIGVNPDLFLELAENIWLRCAGGVHADEILIKAFANAYRWPKVAERLQQRAVEWLAMFWPDPDQGRYLNYNPNTEIAEQQRQATADRYRQWQAMTSELAIQLPLRCVEKGDASWFSHRAIGVLSFLPRRPFVRALVAWAISRAIMGIPRHFEQIAWLLRWNPHDPEESSAALLRETDRLLSFGHSITTDGARWLLEALATPEAMTKVALPPSPSTSAGMSWPNTVRVDQTTGLIHWDHDVALRWPRSEKVPLEATLGLNEHAVDPDLALSPSAAEVLRQLVKNTNIATLWSRPGSHTLKDLGLKHSAEVLSRWVPDALGDLIRRLYASAPEWNWETLRTLFSYLPGYIFLLNEDQLQDLIAATELELKDKNVAAPENVFIPLNLWLARLWNRPATEQIDALCAEPNGFDFNRDHQRILNAPAREDFQVLAHHLTPEAPERQLKTWLGYLSVVGLDQLPVGYPPLVPLVQHTHGDVRRLALEVIYRADDRRLTVAVADSGWRFDQGMNRGEAAYGSLTLCNTATADNVAEIRARIDPQALGCLLTKRNGEASDLDAFADFVKDQIEAVLYRSGPRTIPSYWTDNDEALELLVRHRSDEVLAWLRPLSENHSDLRANVALAESFPLIGLARALLRHRPKEGAQLWLVLEELYKNTILHLEKFEVLPIEAPDHPSIIELRDEVLNRARTDFDLLNIAAEVIEHDRRSWLIDCIERDLRGTSAGLIARAMTLAGFLDSSAEAEAVWSGPLASAPAPGWLAYVHDWSRKLYRRNWWAHQWLDAFVSERDRDRAFGYHALFLACIDRRALIWAPRQIEAAYDTLPQTWRNHWSLRWPEVLDQAKRVDDQHKKRLYGTETFRHTQAPWL